MIIERKKYMQQLVQSKHNGLVKIITGIRRCGKSFLLFNLFKSQLEKEGIDKEHIIEMAFDDFANREYRDPEKFYQYVKAQIKDGRMYYVLLDEVQMMDQFEDVLNGLLHIPNVDVYVTGSNAKFLSKDIITEFRGRGYQIHVSPLSFSEFMTTYNGSKEDGWIEYLQYGGLPPVVLQPNDEEKIKFLKDLWQETYLIDIFNRNHIKNNAELEELLCMLASGIGGLINPQKLSNTFKTNNNTGVAKGTVIQLLPQLRNGSEDSGQWQWNTGETTRNLTVTTNESYVYRVCYTHKHGVKSYLCFSLAPHGDCEPPPVEVSATYNGVTATDSITIFYDDAITLKATSKDGFGSFAWSTGATSSNITVKNLRNDTLFTVAFKNQGGAISYDTIRVHLKYFRPQMAVNGKVKVDTVQCLCQPGDKVAFAPYVPSTFKDIRFQWSSGSTERSVTYNDIQTTMVATLVYTLFGKSDTVCYVAYLSDTLDSAIPEGYYLIRDRFHDTYLTNNTVEGLPYANATFTAKKESDALQQQAWKVTNENVDGPCYDLQNLADQRYLALSMRMTASTRTPYYFRKATGTQWYHLRNKRPCYFTINDDGTVDHTTYYVPTNFPVELIPYTLPAGIHDIHADKVSDDKRYNIQGQRVGADYKGLIIHNGKKYIIR